ncbi:hypothetical protein ACHAWF_008648 [Thalassiosira exigua]
MTAAAKKSGAPRKRSVSPSSGDDQPPKKKSPLFNLPQNYYAPSTIASMSKEELTEWRKEQRRKRNRDSAAASRNKTRARIDELEGEVSEWRAKCAEMEEKMRCMERHIQFLTKMKTSAPHAQFLGHPSPPPLVVSQPNSPPRSPSPVSSTAVPNAVPSSFPPPPAYSRANSADLFPPLLSEPKKPSQVDELEAAAAPVVSDPDFGKHIIQISRQASSFDHLDPLLLFEETI